jgi:hypothetical protein
MADSDGQMMVEIRQRAQIAEADYLNPPVPTAESKCGRCDLPASERGAGTLWLLRRIHAAGSSKAGRCMACVNPVRAPVNITWYWSTLEVSAIMRA